MKTKNNYHKVLGVIYLTVIFAAIVSVVYLWQAGNKGGYTFPVNQHRKTVYTNEEFGFELAYPGAFKMDLTHSQENYFRDGGITVISISIPKGPYSKTNLTSADINYAVKKDTNQADCVTYSTSANSLKRMNQTVKIEPGTFYIDTFQEGAAGTAYRTEIYRMLREGVCFEISMTVGIANIGNYEPGTVKEVIKADVWNELSAILVGTKFSDISQ